MNHEHINNKSKHTTTNNNDNNIMTSADSSDKNGLTNDTTRRNSNHSSTSKEDIHKHNNDDDDDKKHKTFLRPPSDSFVTTTDVLNSINRTLHELNQGGSNTSSSLQQQESLSYFELQRRLPDGTTRKASPSEQAALDCQTRIQQASQWLSTLQTRSEIYEWVQVQRLYGNQLYQQHEYENAIQVYFTCLPAVITTKTDHEKEEEEDIKYRLLLYCQIMNNLAQSALQLQWYKKAETFCTMALDYFHQQHEQQYGKERTHMLYHEQLSKLYYRRGKARMYRGDLYQAAKHDFEMAMKYTSQKKNHHLTLEQRVIQKEIQQLQYKMKQAKHNQQKQKESLQKVLNASRTHTTEKNNSSNQGGLFVSSSKSSSSSSSVSSRKAYSTLRAMKKDDVVKREQQQQESELKKDGTVALLLLYWDYYLAVAGRVAQSLLKLLGDDDDDDDNNSNNIRNKKHHLA